MKWNEERMKAARLIHGLGDQRTDTYRLHLEADGEKDGLMLDVPGWFVGDPDGVALRLKAAAIIRQRILDGEVPS